MDQSANVKTDRTVRYLSLIGMALTIFGAKLLLIDQFGSNVPFWDQWDAEGLFLYAPYLNGTLSLGDLFAAHNEHRIFVTRIFNLALLEMNGLWFPMLQMVANAALHVGVLVILVFALGRPMSTPFRVAFAAFVALAFVLPFGWENTLAGFQSQFYFVFGFSLLANILMVSRTAFSPRWLLGFGLLFLASLSMSSGVLAFAALVATGLLQMLTGVRARTVLEIVGLLVLTLAFLLIYQTVPVIEAHEALRAASLAEFLIAIISVAAWPTAMWLPAAIILNLPMIILLARVLQRREPLQSHLWLLVGLMAWVALQWVSIAYGRAEGATASRYADTLMIGVIANLAAAIQLLGEMRSRLRWMAGATYAAVIIGAVVVGGIATMGHANSRGEMYDMQLANLRAFMATGNIEILRGNPAPAIPYPDADRLAMIVTDPAVRSVLHPEVTGEPASAELLLPDGLNWIARAGQFVLLKGAAVTMVIGFVAMVGAAILAGIRFRTARNAAE